MTEPPFVEMFILFFSFYFGIPYIISSIEKMVLSPELIIRIVLVTIYCIALALFFNLYYNGEERGESRWI